MKAFTEVAIQTGGVWKGTVLKLSQVWITVTLSAMVGVTPWERSVKVGEFPFGVTECGMALFASEFVMRGIQPKTGCLMQLACERGFRSGKRMVCRRMAVLA